MDDKGFNFFGEKTIITAMIKMKKKGRWEEFYNKNH